MVASRTTSRITRGERARGRERARHALGASSLALISVPDRQPVCLSVRPSVCPECAHAGVRHDRAPIYLPRVPCSMARQHAVERPRVELAAEMRPQTLSHSVASLFYWSLLSPHIGPLSCPSTPSCSPDAAGRSPSPDLDSPLTLLCISSLSLSLHQPSRAHSTLALSGSTFASSLRSSLHSCTRADFRS